MSLDDCCILNHIPFSENIDYLSKNHISDYHLYMCWKQNNSVSIRSKEDISATIPLTISRRLENISWRRWVKQQQLLTEVSPAIINWNKYQDVTWLYGPKFTTSCPYDVENSNELQQLTQKNLQKWDSADDMDSDDLASLRLGSSMTFECDSIPSDNMDSDDDDDDLAYAHLKPVLKQRSHPFAPAPSPRKKLVKFSYVINSREYANGLLFDYYFLDTSCL